MQHHPPRQKKQGAQTTHFVWIPVSKDPDAEAEHDHFLIQGDELVHLFLRRQIVLFQGTLAPPGTPNSEARPNK